MRPVVLMILCLLLCDPAQAGPDLCEGAARRAAQERGVPVDLMLAITLAETGRRIDGRLRPWPWAANAAGRGYWFATRDEAARFARAELAAGRHLFDLGCFQINWHWHGAAFARPEDLLDPMVSARHAADFLIRLRDEFGTWDAAAGAYHSRTPARAAAYGARVAALRRDLRGAPDHLAAPPPADTAPRPRTPSPSAGAGLAALADTAGMAPPGSLVRTGTAGQPFLALGRGGQPWH